MSQKLFNIQNKVKAVKKDADNPFFKSKYFDINGLLAALKPLLNEEGLIVIQPLTTLEGGVNALKTLVIDAETDKTLVESVVALPSNVDPQKMGSAITYFRRYALQSLFLLEAEDDDANSATGNVGGDAYNTAPPAPKYKDGGRGKCPSCGANMVMNPKTSKVFCEKKCWLRPQTQEDKTPNPKDSLPF